LQLETVELKTTSANIETGPRKMNVSQLLMDGKNPRLPFNIVNTDQESLLFIYEKSK